MSIHTCQRCGAEFEYNGNVKHCPDCRTTCVRCQGVRAAQLTPKADTSIEMAIQKVLEQRQIPFKKQVPLCGITLADFLLPSYNVVIYCDGVYWHSFPERQEQDRQQAEILEANGYTVYRFTGDEIRVSPDNCVNKLGLPAERGVYQLGLPICVE